LPIQTPDPVEMVAGFPPGVDPSQVAVVAQGLVEVHERGSFGGSVILGRPMGEFQQFVDLPAFAIISISVSFF